MKNNTVYGKIANAFREKSKPKRELPNFKKIVEAAGPAPPLDAGYIKIGGPPAEAGAANHKSSYLNIPGEEAAAAVQAEQVAEAAHDEIADGVAVNSGEGGTEAYNRQMAEGLAAAELAEAERAGAPAVGAEAAADAADAADAAADTGAGAGEAAAGAGGTYIELRNNE